MHTDQRQQAVVNVVETVTDMDIVKLKPSDYAIATHYLAAAFNRTLA